MKSSRRDFLQISGLGLGALSMTHALRAQAKGQIVSIIADPADPVVSSPPCVWAVGELLHALEQRVSRVGHFASPEQAPIDSFCVVVSGTDRPITKELLKNSGAAFSNQPDCLAIVPFSRGNRRGTLVCGDVRGLLYATLELTDGVQHSEYGFQTLRQQEATTESPFNSVRSVGRIFCSDIQDKPWFNDREMWPAYFSMLAKQRFNRFSLNMGVGYDFLDNVRDAYFLFVYPFLLSVPGYNVRAVNLPDTERDHNLEMLQFISAQAVSHGIDFQLGIWTHGYKWGPASPANYIIDGITTDNHAAYSRDALTALLKACPNISGVTLRTHGESGVREGSYAFWSTVFSALPASGRTVRLDLHTKGLDQNLIGAALQTGMPLTLSPKYWAEHMGLPYQQAAIRELEIPHDSEGSNDFFSLSSGSRSFTRYGYADFLREDRRYDVMFRIWPGSHRLLLWGDPRSLAAHSRAFQFCGCNGVELFEPLSFKGRRGSGIAGSRCAYADASLEPHWDWQKYLYTYRTWGRLMYNPDGRPEIWQRYLHQQFQAASTSIEAAFANATPIMNIITTSHLPSAANEGFSPEYYTNQSIVDAAVPSPYSDTPSPKVFGNVSPLDPQLFSTISEFVAEQLKGTRTGKYSPVEVAGWLDSRADAASSQLAEAEARVKEKRSPEFRRAAVDLGIQIGIGHFFAAKLRSGVLYAVYEQTGDNTALDEALRQYKRARKIWNDFAERARDVYVSDITFGTSAHQRGNWLDRLSAIDADIAEMQKRLDTAHPELNQQRSISLRDFTIAAKRESMDVQHRPASSFVPGQLLEIAITVPTAALHSLAIRIYYRHVNQAERYQWNTLRRKGACFSTAIPATYTNSKYPLQYYFELRSAPESAWLFPGLGNDLQAQPYFVIRPASGRRVT